jgi:hypothetical protein
MLLRKAEAKIGASNWCAIEKLLLIHLFAAFAAQSVRKPRLVTDAAPKGHQINKIGISSRNGQYLQILARLAKNAK